MAARWPLFDFIIFIITRRSEDEVAIFMVLIKKPELIARFRLLRVCVRLRGWLVAYRQADQVGLLHRAWLEAVSLMTIPLILWSLDLAISPPFELGVAELPAVGRRVAAASSGDGQGERALHRVLLGEIPPVGEFSIAHL